MRFARRLLAVANPAALASAEAARDPLAALAFLCPEEGSMVEAGWGGGWWVEDLHDYDHTQVGFWICEADFFGVESVFF